MSDPVFVPAASAPDLEALNTAVVDARRAVLHLSLVMLAGLSKESYALTKHLVDGGWALGVEISVDQARQQRISLIVTDYSHNRRGQTRTICSVAEGEAVADRLQ